MRTHRSLIIIWSRPCKSEAASLTMHIQGCEAADAHYDSYENKQAAYCAVESLRTHPKNCYEAEKPRKKLKFGGMIAL